MTLKQYRLRTLLTYAQQFGKATTPADGLSRSGVRNVVKMRLRSEYGKGFGIPRNMTAERMFMLVMNVFVRYDRAGGRLYLEGAPKDRERAMSFIDALGIDPATLLG